VRSVQGEINCSGGRKQDAADTDSETNDVLWTFKNTEKSYLFRLKYIHAIDARNIIILLYISRMAFIFLCFSQVEEEPKLWSKRFFLYWLIMVHSSCTPIAPSASYCLLHHHYLPLKNRTLQHSCIIYLKNSPLLQNALKTYFATASYMNVKYVACYF